MEDKIRIQWNGANGRVEGWLINEDGVWIVHLDNGKKMHYQTIKGSKSLSRKK